MQSTLRIMEWNANGLLQHQQELQVILSTEKIDVCLISETHLTKHSHVRFNGYVVYHTIHPDNTARGGSAVIIKESILHTELAQYSTQEIQATAVEIRTDQYSFTIAGLYSPPRHSIKKEQYLEYLNLMGTRFIIGGDFNAKHIHWGSRLTTTKGRELLKAILEVHAKPISTGKPTYWPTDRTKIPDLIDFFLIKNITYNYISIEESRSINSDHSPIILILGKKIKHKERYLSLTNNKTDWKGFKQEIESKIVLNAPLKTKGILVPPIFVLRTNDTLTNMANKFSFMR